MKFRRTLYIPKFSEIDISLAYSTLVYIHALFSEVDGLIVLIFLVGI